MGERRVEPGEEAVLRAIVEGVEAETGEEFFRSLVRHVATALQVQYAFVSEFTEDRLSFRTRALWGRGRLLDNITVRIVGTPCESVLGGELSHVSEALQRRFPSDHGLASWAAESYCGVPVVDAGGAVVGHVAIMDDREMPEGHRALSILRIFAARARAELERLRIEEALRESEEDFRDLYDQAPISYIWGGPDGRALRANRQAAELFGYSPEQMVGSNFRDVAGDSPDGGAKLQWMHEAIYRGEEVPPQEVEFKRIDGTPIWAQLSTRAIRDATGKVVGVRAMAVDITARKRAEQALRESEGRYRDLFDEAPVGYVLVGGDGLILDVNRGTREMFRATAEQMIGRPFHEFDADSPNGRAKARALWGEFLEGGGGVAGEDIEAVRPDGSRFWIRVWVRPFHDPTGRAVVARVAFVDVTEEKRAREALRASEDRLARILDGAMDAIVTVDEGRVITLFNGAAERIFGCSASAARGRSIDEFLTDPFRAALVGAMGDDGRPSPYLWAEGGLRARRAGGGEFAVEATLSAVKVERRRLFTLILRDVEERRRAEEDLRQLSRQKEYLEEEIRSVYNFEEIVGDGPAIREVLDKIALVAPTDSTVLVVGETGTGKELVARAVHSNSPRRERPLIKVNCAAIPAGLIESELFGHEKGAFTGATEKRIGRFELANRGTIFLDEIGEMPLDVQSKLLRVLQEQEFERVGGSKTIRVDVRIIAATNRDLESAVTNGQFRRDLFYRLNVFPVIVPSLRDRPEDIPPLVHYFVTRYATKIGRRITHVSDAVLAGLVAYSWPGNVRELENVVERAVILSSGRELDVSTIGLPTGDGEPPAAPEAVTPSDGDAPTLEEVERRHIRSILEQTGWRIEGPAGAARLLGLNPSTLRSRMQKLGLRRQAA